MGRTVSKCRQAASDVGGPQEESELMGMSRTPRCFLPTVGVAASKRTVPAGAARLLAPEGCA